MDDVKPKPNYFVRFLIGCLCLMIASMVGFKFVYTEPRGGVDAGLLSLICLLIILVLSETFDSFSVGKLISVSREVKKKEKEVDKLERRNAELISQMISISNTHTQTQSHTNVYGDYHVAPSVRPATEEEVQDKLSIEEKDKAAAETVPKVVTSAPVDRRPQVDWRKAEALALEKYLSERKISRELVISEAKLTGQFDGIDPISNNQPIFDAFIRGGGEDVFVEFRPHRMVSPMYRDRLYMMLSKIHHYRVARKSEAYLELVVMKLPVEDDGRYPVERFIESFSPALASGLLRLVTVEFTGDEFKRVVDTER